MNVLVYVKIDQEIGQSLGKVNLHEMKKKTSTLILIFQKYGKF